MVSSRQDWEDHLPGLSASAGETAEDWPSCLRGDITRANIFR